MMFGTPSVEFCARHADGGAVFGVDEAGRGPLAGPVVAAAVLLCQPPPEGLDDSKRLSARRREALDSEIRERCGWAVGVVEASEIDRINILAATMKAMTLAVTRLVEACGHDPQHVLIDGNLTPEGRASGWRWRGEALIGGDALEPSISAASIVAKQWRDRLMIEAARQHPQYGWERNKGYGSPEHMAALHKHGPSPLHRRSFAPVAQQELLR